MADSSWPVYEPLPRDYVHAVGVITLLFNAYEDDYFGLFRHHLHSRLPRRLIEFFYGALNRPDQIDSIIDLFEEYEHDVRVKEAVRFISGHFKWSLETRNLVAHSISDFLGAVHWPGKVSLRKRSTKNFSKLNSLTVSLLELRAVADEMNSGWGFLKDVYMYVAYRDGTLPALTSRLMEEAPRWPEIPSKLPKPISVHDHPLNRIRRSSPGPSST